MVVWPSPFSRKFLLRDPCTHTDSNLPTLGPFYDLAPDMGGIWAIADLFPCFETSSQVRVPQSRL